MRVRPTLLVLVALWGATTGLRCNFFRPATPEPPSGEAITPDYSSPDATLASMALAIEDKGRRNGRSVYQRAFGDSVGGTRGFRAFFDPVSVARSGRPDPMGSWIHVDEWNYYDKFVTLTVGAAAEYDMEWGTEPYPGAPADEEDPAAGTAILRRPYSVTALDGDDGIFIARGNADLYFVRVSSDRWVIVRWDDRETDDPMPNPEALTFGQRRLESQ